MREMQVPELDLIFCGRQDCPPLHSWGPGVRPIHIIHCVTGGRGIFRQGGSTYTLEKGDGFLISPEEPVFYSADRDQPWSYCWVGFDGTGVGSLLQELELGEERPFFHIDHTQRVEQIIAQMLESRRHNLGDELRIKSCLYLFFSVLLEESRVHAPGAEAGKEPGSYVQTAVTFIKNNYHTGVSVADVADYVGINRSYLYALFKKELGISPSEYLIGFRMSKATQMLGIPRYTVENVAYSCGYSDPVVFTKAFRHRYGMTPLKYRSREADEQKKIREQLLVR